MAAGFSESYIRLWSLKGEKLKGFRSDFQSSSIKDGQFRFCCPFPNILTNCHNCSYFAQKDSRERRLNNAEINRAQRSCLFIGL